MNPQPPTQGAALAAHPGRHPALSRNPPACGRLRVRVRPAGAVLRRQPAPARGLAVGHRRAPRRTARDRAARSPT
ncbi:MAG: hypothetical protein MZW92_07290 [Comamonadaceae bacterium]|nr:hypothetical protein [Comamonadaceae bacterium]